MPELIHHQVVSLDTALAVLAGVRAEASRRGVLMGAVVVDPGGRVVASQRMDGAQLAALALATDKAYTAVSFDAPTEAWAQSSAPGQPDWGLASALAGRLVVFAGGVPLRSDGQVVGAIGVSGAAATVDRACADAGCAAAGFEPV